MSTTGWPGGPSTRSCTAISDVMGGISCCVGVFAAYVNAVKTGEGQKVDVSLVGSIVSALEIVNHIYLITGRIPQRIGNSYEASFPYDTFMAKDDDYVVIGAENDRLFGILCDLMKRPDIQEYPRFYTNVVRVVNSGELKPIVEEWLKDFTVDDAQYDELAANRVFQTRATV